jgi:hypothetical protein
MLSDKKLFANRENAQKSTGPRTPEGKRMSSQNAVTHGLLSREALLPGEEACELDRLRAEFTADLAPVGALEVMWVDTIVTMFWKLRRSNRFEAGFFEYQQNQSQSRESKPLRQFTPREELALIFMSYEDRFEQVARHEARLQRQLVQACHELERAQAARRGVSVPPPAALDVIVSTTVMTQPDHGESASVTEVQTVEPEMQIVDLPAPTGDAAPEALPLQTFPEALETETD